MESKYDYIIGIDPGLNGGIAVLSTDNLKITKLTRMPETPLDIFTFLAECARDGRCICYLEKVFGKPGQSASASFTFGKNFGNIEMALLALQIPTELITPQKWQKGLSTGVQGDRSKSEWKKYLKMRAQQLFPYLNKITLCTADALLIVRYAMMSEKVWMDFK